MFLHSAKWLNNCVLEQRRKDAHCQFCYSYPDNQNGIRCSDPCPRINRLQPICHFRLLQDKTMMVHGLKNNRDLDILFESNKRYGVSTVSIKEFLLLEYLIVDPETQKVSRDREWLPKLQTLDGYCYVPKSVGTEIPVILEYLKRQKVAEKRDATA